MSSQKLGAGAGFVSQLFWEMPFLTYYINEVGMRSQLPSRWNIAQGQLGSPGKNPRKVDLILTGFVFQIHLLLFF